MTKAPHTLPASAGDQGDKRDLAAETVRPCIDVSAIPVTVAIINYNGRSLVDETIGSIRRLDLVPAKILLLDDGSTDGSVEHVRTVHSDVRVIALGENTARPNKLRNRALREADTRYVLITDNDITFAPDALRRLLEAIRTLPAAAVCTPRVLYSDDRNVICAEGHRLHFVCASTRGNRNARKPQAPEAPRPAIGCGIQLIDTERIVRTGLLDEDMALGWGDDGEFHMRVHLGGMACYAVPQAHVFHRRIRSAPRYYGQIRNRWSIILLHYRLRTIFLALPALAAYEILLFTLLLTKGATGEYGRALVDVVRHAGRILTKRRWIQGLRQHPDRDLMCGDEMYVPEHLLANRLSRTGFRVLNGCLQAYWCLIGPFV